MPKNETERDEFSLPELSGPVPDCHADGSAPEGYDLADAVCHTCPDKFTCLPAAIDKQLIDSTLDDDQEVLGVVTRRLPYADALARMHEREALGDDPIPDGLKIDVPIADVLAALGKPEAEPEPEAEEEPEEPTVAEEGEAQSETEAAADDDEDDDEEPEADVEEDDEDGDEPEAEEEPPPAPEPKKKAKAKAKPKKKAKAAAPESADNGEPKKKNNMARVPKPRVLDEETMLKRLDKIKLGAAIDLEVGMRVVRKGRDGMDTVVVLTPNGFEYDGETYSSLSAAAQIASGSAYRSGNDYFNLKTSKCTEVRDEDGKVIAKNGMLIDP
jgi:chemotaxis protein histidine kinase CheA